MAVEGRHGGAKAKFQPRRAGQCQRPSWAATARSSDCLWPPRATRHEESPENGARHAPSPGARPAGCSCIRADSTDILVRRN